MNRPDEFARRRNSYPVLVDWPEHLPRVRDEGLCVNSRYSDTKYAGMTMITPLTVEALHGANLAPAATAAVPPEWFKRFGVAFIHDEDDLDSYEFAGISIKGLACGLLRYTHSPVAETTLLGPQGVPADRLVHAFASAFDLPLHCFRWRPLE